MSTIRADTIRSSAGPLANGRKASDVFSRLAPPHLNRAGRIFAAPAATLASILAQFAVLPHPSSTPFIMFFPGVALAAWLAGPLSGLAAVFLTVAAADYFFLSQGAYSNITHARLAADIIYVCSASGIALICGSLHAAMRRAEADATQISGGRVVIESQVS